MSLVKWEPMQELTNFRDAMNRLWENNFGYLTGHSDQDQGQRWMFPVDIQDNPDTILLHAEIPGMKKEDITIHFRDNVLTIRGERKAEKKEKETNHIKTERQYGAFSRSFSMGVPIDSENITASYKDGVLQITLPKQEVAKEKKIDIAIGE